MTKYDYEELIAKGEKYKSCEEQISMAMTLIDSLDYYDKNFNLSIGSYTARIRDENLPLDCSTKLIEDIKIAFKNYIDNLNNFKEKL